MTPSTQGMTAIKTRARLRRSDRLTAACRLGLARLRKSCAAAFNCVPRPKPSCWVPEHMRLDDNVEAGSGSYDIQRRPWWVPILDAIDDPEVNSVALPAGTQIGKTLELQAEILWAAENAPAPGMLVTPDSDTAIELRDRIYATRWRRCELASAKTCACLPEHKWNSRYIDLGSMRVYLAWSGSRQRLRGRPCRYVWLTEVAVYSKGMAKGGDPVRRGAATHQRVFPRLHPRRKLTSEHPCKITELEQGATARYRYKVKCPKCGRLQELRFFPHKSGDLAGKGGVAGYRDAGGELVSEETALKDAHYICEAGCRIDNDQKQAMLESGETLPLGKPGSRRKLGFHLWSVHSETITFGHLAAAYVEAVRRMKLSPSFSVTGWGWNIKPETRVPKWQELGKRNAWHNARGRVPCEAWFLTAAVDVQAREQWLPRVGPRVGAGSQ
jgi:phage terminase large subunit GpA-like protein